MDLRDLSASGAMTALGPGDDDPRSPAGVARPLVAVLGPGDDDPRSRVSAAGPAAGGPLGPGDDDPRSPAGVAAPIRGPLGPGESDGINPDDDYVFLAPPALGPGSSTVSPRQLVRMRKPQREE